MINMKTIFYVKGYSSWQNKELKRAFNRILMSIENKGA